MYLFPELWYVTADCPDDWRRHTGSCDLFVTRYPMEWIDALTFCKLHGGKLAEVESRVENNFLMSQAKLLGAAGFQCIIAECPDDWIKHSGSCYIVVTRYPMQWINAMSFCKTYGATLAEIESAAEDRFLQDQAKSLGDPCHGTSKTVVYRNNVFKQQK
ncbi:snaclec dabocetin subunit alpha-like [Ostrea edulis]|uniref:snaclec dabocetin subunit alpha-like n=1 Tax=Ostrea edulis TaxID=37623 RepID=UPI0024AFEEB0|nr:snaclec dabocetin subunit alpha-like [Ostrea edulis]